jgi:hypothetical protein
MNIRDYLMKENPIAFLPELAVILNKGADAALILQQIQHWMTINERDAREKQATHFFEGRWWVYNTYAEWKEKNFPWLSIATIQRYFYWLRDEKVILMRPHDNDKKGSWVTIDFDGLATKVEIYSPQIDEGKNDQAHQSDEGKDDYPSQIDEGTGDTEITSTETTLLGDSSNSQKGATQSSGKKSRHEIAREKTRPVDDTKETNPAPSKVPADIGNEPLIQAVIKKYGGASIKIDVALYQRLSKKVKVQDGSQTITYSSPLELYKEDDAFKKFVDARCNELLHIQTPSAINTLKNICNFGKPPDELEPGRKIGYHWWQKTNRAAVAEAQSKPVETVVITPPEGS